MSFTIRCFANLAVKYDTWDSLRSFLTSDEGGKLRIIEPVDSHYALVRYTKDVSNFTLEHVAAFRSVVWDKKTNRPVCVAPVKAQDTDIPLTTKFIITDFVDGTMINAWKSSGTEVANIASRSSLGANGKFYSEHSFAELFHDALKMNGGTQEFLDSVLKEGQFASFVLQHREHKTVAPVPYNRVFVSYFGHVDSAGVVTMSCTEMPERLASYRPEVFEESCEFPDDAEGAQKAARKIVRDNQARGYTWQGIVLQDLVSSRRWRVRNHDYVLVRTLRGAEANPMERFLRLRATGQTKQYLNYFREENQLMWGFEQGLRKRTTDLYTAYIDMKKTKQKGMRDLPYCLRPHVYALHGIYIKDTSHPIIKETVIGYVNALGLEDQFKLLSSPMTVPPATMSPVDSTAPQPVPVA